MIEMTLSSWHRIRNSCPGGLRPSTLPLSHGGSPQYWLWHVDGEETFFVPFKLPRSGAEPRKAAVLTTTLGPPPPTESSLHFQKHISQTCRACFYHIRDLRRIRKSLSLYIAKQIAVALVSSKLDYCNSLFHNSQKRISLDYNALRTAL